jgi:uncharacterized membrane-anchored protein
MEGAMLQRLAFTAVLSAGLATSAYAQALQENAMVDAIANLNWQIGGNTHALPSANAVVETRDDDAFLLEDDADGFLNIIEGHEGFDVDALVMKLEGPLTDSFVTYSHEDIGHVSMDDWEEHIDANAILAQIRKNTEADNNVRAEGYPPLFIDGWLEEPYIDRKNAIVFWAIIGHSGDGESFVNAKALKLGRNGFADLVWVGSPEQFRGAANILENALETSRYNEGFRYADFRPGVDTVAAAGIGAIAYQMMTGSKKGTAAVGAGILAIIAALAKKLWILLLLPFVFAWKAIKRLFTRQDPL